MVNLCFAYAVSESDMKYVGCDDEVTVRLGGG